MARVTGLTAERMLEIERNTVINAFRNVDGELIFTTYDGRQINVGNLEGRGIVQTDIEYQVSSSGSDTPVGVWFSEIPELTPGIYLWTRTTLHYTDDTTSVMYSVARIGEDGTPSQDAQFPTTPTNLRLVSNTGIFTDQGPMAEIILEWDPVTQSTTGDFIDLAGYELYQESYSVAKIADGTQVKVLRPSGSSSLYRVLATSKGGVDSDLSPALTVVAATPGLILRDPNTPIVDSDQGVVTVRWDGSYLGTQNNDSASHVVVGIQNGSSWVRHGVPLYEMGTVNVASKPKTNVTAKLFAYDRLGRLTGESEAVTITVEGTPFSSFDDVTQEYLEGIEIQAQNAWDSASAAVKSTLVEYAVGPSEIIAPSSGWSSDTPTRTPGSFIWMRTTVTYGDESTDVFSPVLLTGNDGAAGSPGSPGRSITEVDVMYYSSTSTTTLSGGSWQTTSPPWAEGRYIWSKTVTFYSTGDPTETDPVCITGDKGDKGDKGATGSSGKGISSTVVSYANSTNGSTTPTSGWQSTVPTVPPGNYLWTRTVITYTDNATSTAYSVARMGSDGNPGTPGSPGAPGAAGVGVESIIEEYYLSTSATAQSGGSWGTSVPGWVDGRYYWTRSKITYTNGDVDTTKPKNVTGGKGSTGATGVSVTSVVQFYQVLPIDSPAPAKPANSVATPPSPWQLTEPDYVEDTNLWVVTRVNFSNSTRSYSEVSKVSAYTAASTAQKTNMKILRTVDGLNRVFVSEESPGRGYIGYENLAPKIEPSGTWAEVRRNYVANPDFETGVDNWTTEAGVGSITRSSNSWGVATGSYCMQVTGADSGLTLINTAVHARTTGGVRMVVPSGREYVGIAFSARRSSSTPLAVQIVSYWYTESGVYKGATSSPDIHPIIATTNDMTSNRYVHSVSPLSDMTDVTRMMPIIRFRDADGVSIAPASFQAHLDAVHVDFGYSHDDAKHRVGVYVSGNEPNFSIDPDMRQRWLGEENASESVMEIQTIEGYTNTSRAIAGLTTYEGRPAIRGIRTVVGESLVRMLVPPSLRPLERTVVATSVLQAPQTHTWQGTIQYDYSPWSNFARPAEAGAYEFKFLDSGSGANYRMRFGYSNSLSDPDVIWTNLGLYAGTLPDDAEPFHNGDLWFRTGWKEQEVGASTYGVQEVLIWNGQDWVPYKLVVDSLAAANSVTTAILNVEEIWGNSAWLDQLEVGVITTNMLSSKFGDDLDISSNSSITLMVGDGTEDNPGRLQELDTEIGKVDSKVDDTTKLITDTGGINDKIDNLNTLTDKIQASFRIESDRVSVIAMEGAPNRLDIYPDAIRMVSGSVTVAEITQEHIEIKAGKFTEAIIGNHLMTTTPDGRTIFTPKDN